MGLLEAQSFPDQASENVKETPGILVIGPRGAGKQTLVNRLIRHGKASRSAEREGALISRRWKVDTKYYTADVNVVVARVEDHSGQEGVAALAAGCQALVLVFDLSNEASFAAVVHWAKAVPLDDFPVLLCIGNKADQMAEHQTHQMLKEARPEHWEQVGGRLLQSEPSDGPRASSVRRLEERRAQYSSWCVENGMEYVEACALDELFDEGISLDGDQAGISRVRSALHAHMWPGMKLKPRGPLGISETRSEKDVGFTSGDESDFSVEYELLPELPLLQEKDDDLPAKEGSSSSSGPPVDDLSKVAEVVHEVDRVARAESLRSGGDKEASMEDIEQMMREMAGARSRLQGLPDAARRQMAADLALKMLRTLEGSGDGEDWDDE